MVKHLIALLVFSCWTVALAAVPPELDPRGLKACGTFQGVQAIDGARFEVSGGTVVKLALVKSPELWPTGSAYKSWPHAQESKDALDKMIRGQNLRLFCEGNPRNRLDETVAHVVAEGVWIQATLVEDGHALVFPAPTRSQGLDTLYGLEDRARQARRGLWAFNNLQPVATARDAARPGWFQIVAGTVLKANKVGKITYLNFGMDWRTDFTIEIPAAAARRFTKAGIDILALAGKSIEARGWIDYKAGPRLVVLGPGQMRVPKEE